MSNLSLDTQQALFKAVNQAPNLCTALKNILSNICEFARWDYGEAWVPCKEGTILELYPVSYITSHRSKAEVLALEQFHACTKGFTFPPAIGLPGRVWSSQQAEWLPNASSQSEGVFLRHKIAQAFGVKTGYGIPILANHKMLAVLVFFMLDVCEEDRQLTELVATIAAQIGVKLEELLREE